MAGIPSMSIADPHLLDPLCTVDEKGSYLCSYVPVVGSRDFRRKTWFSASSEYSSFDFCMRGIPWF